MFKKILPHTILAILSVAGCSKAENATPAIVSSPPLSQPDMAKPTSEDELAKIRELMEKDEARKTAAEQKSREFGEGMKKGGAEPIRELKY